MKRVSYGLEGWALTPVHVGDGTVWTPEGYRLAKSGNRDVLQRFDPPSVIAAMTTAQLEHYMAALSKPNGLKVAQEIIQKAAGDDQVRETIQVSETALHWVRELSIKPEQRGDLKPFVRSGGAPYLPGTTLKGAFRTAWLAAALAEIPSLKPAVSRDLGDMPRKGVKIGPFSDKVQRKAFDMEVGKTEQDPLGDLYVADAALSDDPTLIDGVQIANLTKDGPISFGQESGISIHVERLTSIADGTDFSPTAITCAIAMPDAGGAAQRVNFAKGRASGDKRAIPSNVIHIDALRSATNTHHAKLWMMERKTFYQGTGTDTLMDSLLTGFGLAITDATNLAHDLDKAGAWLIKIGRYAHFESKSVEGLRFGEKRGKRGKNGKPDKPAAFMHDSGGSRTLAKRADTIALPFGWIILFDKGRAPASAPQLKSFANVRIAPSPPSGPARAFSNSPPPRPTSVLAGQFRFTKGQKLIDPHSGDEAICDENVSMTASEMWVTFDGERENVKVTGWKPA
jgi:CRISPR-associated protein Csm5